MTDMAKSTDAEDITKLLTHYSFDLDGCSPEQLIYHWAAHYPMAWIRLAVVEALYQGRYKVVSVEQILAIWQRRQKPLSHFNGEFERIVSSRLPKSLRERSPEEDVDSPSLPYGNFRSSSTSSQTSRTSALHRIEHPQSTSDVNWRRSPTPSFSSPSRPAKLRDIDPTFSQDQDNAGREPAMSQAIATEEYSLLRRAELSPSALSSVGADDSTYNEPASSTDVQAQASSHPSASDSGTAQWSVQYPLRTPSIAQFVPSGRSSGFYSRLKSVVRQESAISCPLNSEQDTAET